VQKFKKTYGIAGVQ